MRVNLISGYKGPNKLNLVVSSPVDIEFEIYILTCALNLMTGMLNTKYTTTLEEDLKLFSEPIENGRLYLALVHRITQKEILRD